MSSAALCGSTSSATSTWPCQQPSFAVPYPHRCPRLPHCLSSRQHNLHNPTSDHMTRINNSIVCNTCVPTKRNTKPSWPTVPMPHQKHCLSTTHQQLLRSKKKDHMLCEKNQGLHWPKAYEKHRKAFVSRTEGSRNWVETQTKTTKTTPLRKLQAWTSSTVLLSLLLWLWPQNLTVALVWWLESWNIIEQQIQDAYTINPKKSTRRQAPKKSFRKASVFQFCRHSKGRVSRRICITEYFLLEPFSPEIREQQVV